MHVAKSTAASGADLGLTFRGCAGTAAARAVVLLALGLAACAPQRRGREPEATPGVVRGGPEAVPPVPRTAPSLLPAEPTAPRAADAGVGHAEDRAGIDAAAVDAALSMDIAALSDALREGPVGSRGARLASLRMVAVARVLEGSGSRGAAHEALQRALALDASDAYACFWMAQGEIDGGHPERAARWAARARPSGAAARLLGPALQDLARHPGAVP